MDVERREGARASVGTVKRPEEPKRVTRTWLEVRLELELDLELDVYTGIHIRKIKTRIPNSTMATTAETARTIQPAVTNGRPNIRFF